MSSFWIPEGSTINVNPDNSLTINPASGWDYFGYDESSVLRRVTDPITVSCTCQTTGNCSPFVATGPGGQTAGCAGDCTKCLMEQSASLSDGGYLRLSEEARLITTNEEFPGPFKALFGIQEIAEKIQSFLNDLFEGQSIPEFEIEENEVRVPEGYLLAFADIGGRGTIVPIPANKRVAEGADGNKASCSGCAQGGTCVLKEETIFGMGAIWCQADDCKGTCTLKISRFTESGGEVTIYEAPTYLF